MKDIRMMEGYDECTRMDGSKFYLCQLCIEFAHSESSEDDIKSHLVSSHRMG